MKFVKLKLSKTLFKIIPVIAKQYQFFTNYTNHKKVKIIKKTNFYYFILNFFFFFFICIEMSKMLKCISKTAKHYEENEEILLKKYRKRY